MGNRACSGIVGRRYAVTGLLIAILIASVAPVAAQLNEVIRLEARTGEVHVPQLQRIAFVGPKVTQFSLPLRHAILARSPAELQGAIKDVRVKRALLEEQVGAYAKGLDGTDAAATTADIQRHPAAFWKVGDTKLKLIQEGRKEDLSWVAQAITHVDQATHHSAALVEENVAADAVTKLPQHRLRLSPATA